MRRSREKGPARQTASRGYTLVEMVMVMVILGILGSITAFVIVESMKVYARTAPAVDASYQARLAVERMRREIRDMKDTASITAFTATTLTFDDTSSNTIAYALSGGNLMRNGDLLAKGVTSLAFAYWKSDGATAAAAADLHLVEIDLTVTTGSEPYRIQTAVFPRLFSSMIGSGGGGSGGGGGTANPLNETGSQATATAPKADEAALSLISEVAYALQIASFSLSADRAMPKLKTLEINGDKIWKQKSGVSLPTGTQGANKGSVSERTIPAGGSVTATLEFKDDPTAGPVVYTLVVNFMDGTSSTLTFTVNW